MTVFPQNPEENDLQESSFDANLTHIIGIGASAGGLDPLERFFDHMPKTSSMAFVIIQHLSPDFKSLMDELLARHTDMPIHRVIDGMMVEAGNIYLIPPKKDMIIQQGRLRLSDKDQAQFSLPIDTFFRSLAQDAGDKSVAIILSGTGSDGSRSLIDFHQAGGLIIVQSPESSAFDGMPRSAIETGLVDVITEPELMPDVLRDHADHSLKGADVSRMMKYETGPTGKFSEVFRLLKDKYKIDFGFYKPTTVDRRIERRMNILRFDTIEPYYQRLVQDPEELNALYKDLLIGVTKYFRDPKAFEALGERVIPEIIRRASEEKEEEIRAWVCGCATGEEAYSLAILFSEVAESLNNRIKLKIFATDVHRASLDIASDGIYDEAELENLSEDLKEKYFHRENGRYRANTHIRQLIVFSEQNVLTDPPFIKIDLVSCRNLLIYFQIVAQRKALAMFHFALKHKAYLFLGSSENLGAFEDEFDTIERSWKIFRKKRDVRLPTDMRLTLGAPSNLVSNFHPAPPLQNVPGDMKLLRAYDHLLERFMPPGLLISENRQLLHAFGDAGRFFKTISGRLSSDVLNLVDGDLRIALTSALQRCIKDNVSVKYKSIMVQSARLKERIDLEIEPLQVRGSVQNYYLILLSPSGAIAKAHEPQEIIEGGESFDASEVSKERIAYLEQELQYTKEHLQTTVEELETSNEELQATNEELLASNEELQSTNEELHSVNEELYTVNAEYERKNSELEQLADDMENLLRSTEIGTVFVDPQLRIRKYTPAIAGPFNLLPQDIGRPIEHIAYNIQGHNSMLRDIRMVIEQGNPHDLEVQTHEGKWMLQRILPYRNSANTIEGAVITFIDIDKLKQAEEKLKEINQDLEKAVEERAKEAVESNRLKGLVIEATSVAVRDWDIIEDTTIWSGKMKETFGYSNGRIENSKAWWSNKIGPNDWERVTESLDEHIHNKSGIWKEEYHFYRADGSLAYVLDWCLPIRDSHGKTVRVVGAMLDISELKEAQKTMQRLLRKQQTLVMTIGKITYEYEHKKDFTTWTGVEMLGYDIDEFEPELQFRYSLIHPEDVKIYQKEFERVKKGKANFDVECRYRHDDGHYIWFHDRGIAYFNHKGELETIIGVLEDITLQREHQQELETEFQRLKTSNEDLERFAAIAANDLKEPIHTISNYAELLQNEFAEKNNSEYQQYTNLMLDGTSRMTRLIDALLDYSKVSSGELTLKKASICNSLRSALKNLQGLIEEKHADIEIGDLPSLHVDEEQMVRVFQNLLENAIKYNDASQPKISISAKKAGSVYEFSISDNGVGIGQENLKHVFDLFSKVIDTVPTSGSGIGLATCKRIINRHGGNIRVESVLGEGSTFYFTLPIKK
ncbi:signal transduction histidine kinase with CheB and CheR activity [Chloroherpeton thalassium ATCC 35110]|uniref:Signal transduction histidine kinase with CheB and CheR activity n=1 Tax=Chloroherpeton thalassium (strain ATCC 35110 / GB-78) TaxID=517418 RepID=B3QSR4_CHLT3|nr:chemotaxis protein CheB [Chloroherpeton thalassium]ACF14111.1 signal transduction histidine kinase with CheB and CheR activity [Chloroherpeton thalassium ATCC 35110]